MKPKAYKPTDVFRNTIECGHCGVKYDFEFTYGRFLENKIMVTVCPTGHIQDTKLRLVCEGMGPIRLLDRIDFQRCVKCDSLH